ncbi:MAG: DUF6220 domain-containing protein [Actinomycetes bacterium]
MTAPAPAPAAGAPASGAARAHRGLAILFLVAGLIQFFLAGLGAFGEGYDPHRIVGTLMILIALILLILAFVGRREALQASAILFGLMILQSLLAVLGAESSAFIGGLHAVNALLILFAASMAAAGRTVSAGAVSGRGHG